MIEIKEKEEMQKTFKALDTDGDGILDKEELIKGEFLINLKSFSKFFQGYSKIMGNIELAKEKAEKIIEEVDSNKSGKIDFSGIFCFLKKK